MYVVTFRIADKTINGKTYQNRYDALVSNLAHQHDGFWFDTTSFYIVGSNENTTAFATRIVRGLSSQHDMLFVFDPEDMSACCFGSIEAVNVLTSFFPRLQRVR